MTNARLRYLDVLKVIAIFSVVMYHIGILEYGYLGIDIFLVLSDSLETQGRVLVSLKSDSGMISRSER